MDKLVVVAAKFRNEFVLATNISGKNSGPGALGYLIDLIRIGGNGAYFLVVGSGNVAAEGG